jgi:serralysin
LAHIDDSLPGSTVSGNPYLNSLLWGCGWARDLDNPTGPIQIAVHFGAPGEDLPGYALSWIPSEMAAFGAAFQLYANVANIEFVETANYDDADMVEWVATQSFFDTYYSPTTLGAHELPDPSETMAPPYGYFNTADPSWSDLSQGSYGFITIIHELGHALGLAHPHDGGSEDGQLFPGVTRDRPGDEGDFGLNQGIWTTMTYNDGWDDVPPVADAFGYQGTPMAFDIAALQYLYGANYSTNNTDTVYSFDPTTGQMFVNGAGQGVSSRQSYSADDLGRRRRRQIRFFELRHRRDGQPGCRAVDQSRNAARQPRFCQH